MEKQHQVAMSQTGWRSCDSSLMHSKHLWDDDSQLLIGSYQFSQSLEARLDLQGFGNLRLQSIYFGSLHFVLGMEDGSNTFSVKIYSPCMGSVDIPMLLLKSVKYLLCSSKLPYQSTISKLMLPSMFGNRLA